MIRVIDPQHRRAFQAELVTGLRQVTDGTLRAYAPGGPIEIRLADLFADLDESRG